MILNKGKWTEEEIDSIIRKASLLSHAGEKVGFISSRFLGTAYRESTLSGTADISETIVIDLEAVDCFTFLDYVEAMRISSSFADFMDNVARVRYRNGRISFFDRNHFFTDWREYNPGLVGDVTQSVGGSRTKKVVKMLNLKGDGTYLLPGLEPKKREISFVPSGDLDIPVMQSLESGDYVGIYSPSEGLDVSHAGILIKTDGSVHLRHASSAEGVRKVVDEDLMRYMAARPGLVVLRPKDILSRSEGRY